MLAVPTGRTDGVQAIGIECQFRCLDFLLSSSFCQSSLKRGFQRGVWIMVNYNCNVSIGFWGWRATFKCWSPPSEWQNVACTCCTERRYSPIRAWTALDTTQYNSKNLFVSIQTKGHGGGQCSSRWYHIRLPVLREHDIMYIVVEMRLQLQTSVTCHILPE